MPPHGLCKHRTAIGGMEQEQRRLNELKLHQLERSVRSANHIDPRIEQLLLHRRQRCRRQYLSRRRRRYRDLRATELFLDAEIA